MNISSHDIARIFQYLNDELSEKERQEVKIKLALENDFYLAYIFCKDAPATKALDLQLKSEIKALYYETKHEMPLSEQLINQKSFRKIALYLSKWAASILLLFFFGALWYANTPNPQIVQNFLVLEVERGKINQNGEKKPILLHYAQGIELIHFQYYNQAVTELELALILARENVNPISHIIEWDLALAHIGLGQYDEAETVIQGLIISKQLSIQAKPKAKPLLRKLWWKKRLGFIR